MLKTQKYGGSTMNRIALLVLVATCLISLPGFAIQPLEMSVSVEGGSNCAFPDSKAGYWRVGSEILLTTDWFTEYSAPLGCNIRCIPTSLTFPQDITVHYRLSFENVEIYNQPSPETLEGFITTYYYYSGPQANPVDYGDYQLGTGEGDYLEFSYTFENVDDTYANQSLTLKFRFSAATFITTHFQFSESYEIVPYEKEGGPLDRWFQLLKTGLPESLTDGAPLSQSGDVETVPAPGETVEIEGEDILYDPSTATTDANGVFGVLAFVDPDAFDEIQKDSASRKNVEKSSKSGNLILKYRNIALKHGITGTFCEVIIVEGTVRLVGGSGIIEKGDILYPGDKLSLSSGWGEKAQIGLRFINGSNARVLQDVFTNACLTDMLVIGKAGFEDISVISGNTPLARVSRYMCEQVAGFPNTPEEWAKATGKVIVTTVASNAVPGSGIVAYTVRYGVETVAGKSYDYMMSSGSSNKTSLSTSGSGRMEISSYYNGSSRVTSNLEEGIGVYDSEDISEPLITVANNQWQEFVDAATTGRLWEENPDSIDTAGPDLRLAGTFDPYTTTIQFELRADDISGLNEATFIAINNGSDVTTDFTKINEGLWQSNPINGFIFETNLSINIEDNLGNASSMDWSGDTIPGVPTVTKVIPAQQGGGTILEWTLPEGMNPEDILFYEIRQTLSGTAPSSWYMVGPVNSATILLPEGTTAGATYSLEIRTCDTSGRIGQAVQTESLTVGIQNTATTLWAVY